MKSKAALLILFLLLLFTAIVGLTSSSQAADGADEFIYLPMIEKPDNIDFPSPSPTPSSTPNPAATSTPTATETAVSPYSCSICSHDTYNCSDFTYQSQAQACHDTCFSLVGSDVHRLDADDDGIACESLP